MNFSHKSYDVPFDVNFLNTKSIEKRQVDLDYSTWNPFVDWNSTFVPLISLLPISYIMKCREGDHFTVERDDSEIYGVQQSFVCSL